MPALAKSAASFSAQSSASRRRSLLPTCEAPLKAGDGIVFDAGQPDEEEEGGRVDRLQTAARAVASRSTRASSVSAGATSISAASIPATKLWKTSDPELDRRLRQSFSGQTPAFPPAPLPRGSRPRRRAADAHRPRRTRAMSPSSIRPAAGRRPKPAADHRELARTTGPPGRNALSPGRLAQLAWKARSSCP